MRLGVYHDEDSVIRHTVHSMSLITQLVSLFILQWAYQCGADMSLLGLGGRLLYHDRLLLMSRHGPSCPLIRRVRRDGKGVLIRPRHQESPHPSARQRADGKPCPTALYIIAVVSYPLSPPSGRPRGVRADDMRRGPKVLPYSD